VIMPAGSEREQESKQPFCPISHRSRIDPFARPGYGREPRNRLAAPGDFDRIASLNAVHEFAEMRPGVRQIDRAHVALPSS
jgi:hypothetical protein